MPFKFIPFAIVMMLVFSSLNTKAMGLAWLLVLLGGLWAWVRNGRSAMHPKVPSWFFIWVVITALALLLKTVPMIYWSDPWAERHGELRLLLGAVALYALARWQPLDRKWLSYMAHALSFSSAMGLAWVLVYGRDAVPTHPIPWAGSMAMCSAVLLALSLKSDFSLSHRRIWFAGGLLAVMAVLSSQSRGAYGIVLWWSCIGLHHIWLRAQAKVPASHAVPKGFALRKWALLGALLMGLGLLTQTPVLERPAQSLQDAIREIRVSQQSTEAGANSSVGARLYMWQKSLIAIQQSPWMGHGHDTRKKLLLDWAETSQSDEVKRLGHVHNEYLHQWVDHGLWGLASQLVYLAGLLFVGWQLLQKKHRTATLSLAGIVFMHMTSSLSNVNFAHNYYTTSLSFFVGLSLWLSQLETLRSEA